MDWDAIGAMVEITGAVVVLVTLVYLSIQIRNNTAMTKASIRQSRVDWSLEWASAFSNSEYLPAIYIKLQNAEELTPEEESRWIPFLHAWHRNLESALLQQTDGLLDGEVLEGQRRNLVDDASGKTILYKWENHRTRFDPRYQTFVDAAISEGLQKG